MKTLLFPIQISPTKALTPSHLKGMFWVDALYRATRRVSDIHYLCNRVSADTSQQTLGFWDFLDARHGETASYDDKSELWIAQEYLRYHTERYLAPAAALQQYRARVEQDLWMHPSGARVLAAWQGQFAALGLYDPGLAHWERPTLGVEEMLETLRTLDVLLDVRELGGAAYIDLTAQCTPLRHIVDEQGTPNYLVDILRELVPRCPSYDRTILVYDYEASNDFYLIAFVLRRLGHKVMARPVSRVPLEGIKGSTRAGGWEAYTVERILARFAGHPLAAVRLGLRTYFLHHMSRQGHDTFSFEILEEHVVRAGRLVDALGDQAADDEHDAAAAEVSAMLRPQKYVDPKSIAPLVRLAPRSASARRLLLELFVEPAS